MVIAAEIPAHADGVVDSERLLIGSGVIGTEIDVERRKGSDAVVGDAQLEMFRERDSEAERFFVGEGRHGPGVFDPRNVVTEEETRLVEDIEVAKRRAREGLKFKIAADDVTRERGTCWLRLIASAEVRLIVRRRDFEIRITADKIRTEKQRARVAPY